jgi:hypothetical protein
MTLSAAVPTAAVLSLLFAGCPCMTNPPRVLSTSPADGATGVSAGTSITVTFDRPADPNSLDGFIQPEVTFSFTWSQNNTVVTVTPDSPLSKDTLYSATITACRFGDGCSLSAPVTFSFTTGGGTSPNGCTLPEAAPGSFAISSISPCDGDTNVSLNASIVIDFNRAADPSTLSAVMRPWIDPVLNWSSNDTRVEVHFTDPLQADTTYTLFGIACFDTSGNPLGHDVQICFSTGPALGECHTPLACQEPDATDPHVPARAAYNYTRFFAPDSPWNTPIGPNPQVDPDSDAMMAQFAQTASQYGGLWLGFDRDTPPVYFADASTPRHTVTLTDQWAPFPTRPGVPIPGHALPDCGDDNFMCILDTVNNRFWDFWQVTKQADGSWAGAWVTSVDSTGSGVYPAVWADGTQGVRASQFAMLAGVVWPQEVAAGEINHALVFVYSFVRAGVYTAPAKTTDGVHNDQAAIPMGARLQLDPTLDLDSLNLTSYERVIAEALQEYGMYLGDSGGGIGLPVVHPYSFAGNPWSGLLPASVTVEHGTLLGNIPADRFRVLQMTLEQAP